MSRAKWFRPLAHGALIGFLFSIPVFVTSPYKVHILIIGGLYVVLSSSLRLVFTSGQLSMAHGGMMSIGAYTSALLVMRLGLSTWAAMAIAGLAAGITALLVGYPFTRVKGVYFAMVTVFLTEIIRLIAEQWRELTGGSLGLSRIPPPDPIIVPGLLNIDFSSRRDFYYLILVLALATLLFLYAVERSPVGLTWRSIEQADFLAESVGINTTRFKVIAFCIGGFFAGIGGAFYAQYISAVTPASFGFLFAVYSVIYVVVGGRGKFAGPILGALILTIVPEFYRGLKEYQPFAYAGLLMVIVTFLPEGLVGLPDRVKKLVGGKVSGCFKFRA